MKTETIFYLLGGIFAVTTIIYFTWRYIFAFPKEVKVFSLICLIALFFFLGDLMKERDV